MSYKRVKHVSGATRIWNPDLKKYEWEHRVIWAKHNGEIPVGYIIHHKNGIKSDNRIDNLDCMTQIEHIEKHRQEMNDGIRKGFKNGRTIWNKGRTSNKL